MSFEEIIEGVSAVAKNELTRCHGLPTGMSVYLYEAIDKLRTHQDNQPNEPLTLEELREMTRKPVWVECKHFRGWAILHIAWPEIYVAAADGNTYFIWTNGEYNERLGAKLYRRPPKESTNER